LKGRREITSLIPKNSVGAEIGVFTGVFSEVLITKVRPKNLYLVDPWKKAHGTHFPKWGDYTAKGALETGAARKAAEKRALKRPGKVSVIEDYSTAWLSEQSQKYLDWVYLDATHRYEAVLEDLQAIEGPLKTDGIICGDDCWTDPGAAHFGVFRAVRDFCATHPFEIFRMDQNGQWAIRRTRR
jgi:hypothetical protein